MGSRRRPPLPLRPPLGSCGASFVAARVRIIAQPLPCMRVPAPLAARCRRRRQNTPPPIAQTPIWEPPSTRMHDCCVCVRSNIRRTCIRLIRPNVAAGRPSQGSLQESRRARGGAKARRRNWGVRPHANCEACERNRVHADDRGSSLRSPGPCSRQWRDIGFPSRRGGESGARGERAPATADS